METKEAPKEQEAGFNNYAEKLVLSGISEAVKPIVAGFVKDTKKFIGKDEKIIMIRYVENDAGQGDVLAVIINTKDVISDIDFKPEAILNDKGEEMVYKIEQYATEFIAGKFDL